MASWHDHQEPPDEPDVEHNVPARPRHEHYCGCGRPMRAHPLAGGGVEWRCPVHGREAGEQ